MAAPIVGENSMAYAPPAVRSKPRPGARRRPISAAQAPAGLPFDQLPMPHEYFQANGEANDARQVHRETKARRHS
jgi:hypothetical protein